jgi:hypothetical protein
MNRLHDWEIRLTDFFVSRLSSCFEWGVNDCCLFAADGKIAATGHDPAAEHRGTYSDALSAARTVERLGGMLAIGDSSFGKRIKTEYVRFGDIGLIENHGRPCLAIFGGEYFHAPGVDGLTIFPVDKCLQAWSLT